MGKPNPEWPFHQLPCAVDSPPYFTMYCDQSQDDIENPRDRFRLLCAVVSLSVISCLVGLSFVSTDLLHQAVSHETILFLPDIHLDPLYDAPADQMTRCHRSNISHQAAPFGRYGCDCSQQLLDSMLIALSQLVQAPDAIVLGGDYSAGVANPPPAFFLGVFHNISSQIRAAYLNVPILPMLGNREFTPNYGIWRNDTGNYKNAADAFAHFLLTSEIQTFSKGGYYFRDFKKFRIVILNTVPYHSVRKWQCSHYNDSTDPGDDPWGQFAWLEQVCRSARASGLEIIVFIHAPSGISTRSAFPYQGWMEPFADRFAEIHRLYNFLMACGHLHMDAFLPLFNNRNDKGGFVLASPGLSPRHGNNPGFRVFRFENGKPVDYDQYFADLLRNPQGDVEWKLEYSFRDVYKAADLSQAEIVKVVAKIAADEELMWKYRSFMYAGNYELRAFHRCMLTALSHEEMDKCLASMNENGL
jgi:sphingomyelin phosphodiesterase acid-like 3